MPKEYAITPEEVASLGYRVVPTPEGEFTKKGVYFKAYSLHDWDLYQKTKSAGVKDKRIISWNCEYVGHTAVTIKEDGGTRTVFNGHVENIEQLKIILSLVL